MSAVTRLTLRGLMAHKRRLLSTCVAVLLGVAFMSGSLVFTDTMRAAFSGAFQDEERSTDVLVRGPVTLTNDAGDQRQPVPAALADRIAAVDGVAAVAPRIEGFAQVLGRDGKPLESLNNGATPGGCGVELRQASSTPSSSSRATRPGPATRSSWTGPSPTPATWRWATPRRCSPAPRRRR